MNLNYNGLTDLGAGDRIAIERNRSLFVIPIPELAQYLADSIASGASTSIYAPLVHTHAIGDITGLTIELGNRALVGHTHTKEDVGLLNVDNTSDLNKPISTATQTALDGKANSMHEHDIADIDGLQTILDSKQPYSAVLDATDQAFTTVLKTKLDSIEAGADVTDATNVNAAGAVMNSDYSPAHSVLVQQSGTGSPVPVQISNNSLLGRLSGGGSNIDALSASDVRALLSINNVNNTSDLDKPISTDAQNALDGKQDTLVSGSNIKTINGVSVLGSGDIPIVGGGGSTATYSANLSFTDPASVKIFDLNIAGVTAGQKLFISEDYEALGDELEFDTLSLAGFVTSADNVRIIANSNGLISGTRPITILAA